MHPFPALSRTRTYPMPKLTQSELDRMHSDFKSEINGVPHALYYDRAYGTCLGPVDIVPNDYWQPVIGVRTNNRCALLEELLKDASIDARVCVQGAYFWIEVSKSQKNAALEILSEAVCTWDSWWLAWDRRLVN